MANPKQHTDRIYHALVSMADIRVQLMKEDPPRDSRNMFIKLYGIALAVFLAIDMLWLTVLAKDLYAKHLGYLMAKSPNLIAAFIFYLIFIAGLVFFVLEPALGKKTWMQVLTSGLLFGLVTYATYDLTNLATIKNWPLNITIIDLLWGMGISAVTSVLTFFIATKLRV